jgi:hypothetical protein
MEETAIVYSLAAVGIILIGLGIYGVIRDRFSQETKGSGPGVSFTLPLSALVLLMGLGSLAGSGYFALNGSKASAANPTTSPATTTSKPSPTTNRPKHSVAVTITRPSYGAKVEECGVFSGTSDLPPGETLVLSARNLSDPTKIIYLEPVNNWANPAAISKWVGYQYFGSGNSSAGQTYEVSALVVKASVVRAALAQAANNPTWAVKSLPVSASVKASIRVVRKEGRGPVVCQ